MTALNFPVTAGLSKDHNMLAAQQRGAAIAAQDTGIARSVIIVLVGVFIIKAAVLSSAKQVKGLDAIFRSVASSPYGSWLLALLASGLLCHGLYCLLEARYRDLTPGHEGRPTEPAEPASWFFLPTSA